MFVGAYRAFSGHKIEEYASKKEEYASKKEEYASTANQYGLKTDANRLSAKVKGQEADVLCSKADG